MNGLLVGYGSIGRRHLANLHALGVTDWAVVHTGKGTLALDPPCPVRVYPSLDEALDSESADFAVIANPSALHAATAIACAEAGCDLLVEKPLAMGPGELDAVASAVAARRVEVLVGFQFRFEPALQHVRALIQSAEVGSPLHARAEWGEYLPDWHPWENWREGYAARRELGGGVHHTLCHPFDYLRMLFGDVTDVGGRFITPGPLGLGVAEGVDASLQFGSGVTAHVHLNYWTRPRVHRLEVVCSRGTITWDHMTGEVRSWAHGADSGTSRQFPGIAGRDEVFREEARHFLAVVERSSPPRCTLDDGAAAVRVCAALEAAAQRAPF